MITAILCWLLAGCITNEMVNQGHEEMYGEPIGPFMTILGLVVWPWFWCINFDGRDPDGHA